MFTDSPVPAAAFQGTLALDLQPALDPPEVGSDHLESLATSDAGTAPGQDLVDVPDRLRRELLRWALRFGQAAAEIVNGDRPPGQLARHTSREVQADLTRRALLVARAAGSDQGLGRRWSPEGRPRVVSVHGSFLSNSVAEVCLRVQTGQRHRAIAARFEVDRGRWLCRSLEFA
ncbi:Rv3235 family protein [Nocardioides limicola]|uniref:Rv3235 family protein n=1 Tax=Nocardioides limicola TaxID=2803368 RepID=UPI00193C65C0|nr:Rv3235 family protein [Nocardioides sp. DJM-14]